MGSGGASDEADELNGETERRLLGELRVGPAARPLVGLLASLVDAVEALDPAQVPARDAMDLVRVFDRIERLGCTGKALAAGRVAESSLWSRSGHRSPAQWMATVTDVGVGDATKLLETAEAVADAPATKDALLAGTVSPRQARAAGRAETADPEAGRELLGRLTSSSPGEARPSVVEVEKEATRIVNAAAGETPAQIAARHRAARRFRHGTRADGMGWGHWLVPPAEQTAFVAQFEALQQQVFAEKRAAGEREPAEAYAADALTRLFRRARRRDETARTDVLSRVDAAASSDGADAPGRGGPDDTVEDDWSFTKVIVKVDLTALDRGRLAPGEICEVAGRGPVPVADVWRMIDGDAVIAAVATKGVEISKVVHLGRRPTALQRTALDWIGDGTCTIDDCTSRARLEVDHVADWAATRRTELAELADVCGRHHDLKTHHGYTFGPLRPDGRRALIPPDDTATGPPSGTGPPSSTRPPSGGTGPAERAGAAIDRGQGHLFDKG